ncbi:MAG: hypothetical protein WBY88_01615 [Desulfosarcina sp.]
MVPCSRFALLLLSLVLLDACSSTTIFLRPALDTPIQHVENGHNLLSRGKIDAAHAEFVRARSLADDYAPAYVGLALIQGYRGDVDGGLKTLARARRLADTPDDVDAVNRGYDRLRQMQSAVDN